MASKTPQDCSTTGNHHAAAQPPRLPPESKASAAHFALVNLSLRLLLLASALAGVLVMVVTSKQTELIPIPIFPYQASRSAKFNHSPAFIYYIATLSVWLASTASSPT